MNGPEVLIPIAMIITPAVLIFGIAYMRTRQNLAMIEKGMNPKENVRERPAPFRYLKWALLLIGAGIGLFVAFFLHQFVFYPGNGHHHEENAVAAVYFALIAIGGGSGLFYSYLMEKKWWDKQDDKVANKE